MKKSLYNHIAILGPGLLGGSLGMAVRARLSDVHVTAWARKKEVLAEVLNVGAADSVTDDMGEAVREADLIVMATPVGTMGELAKKIAPSVKPGAVVTDVGSVKRMVHQSAGQVLTQAGVAFIGSHPMAGSEKQGITAARENLFVAAPLVLTNDEGIEEEKVGKLSDFWASLGCLCYRKDAEHHDHSIARISHLTHLLSALASKTGITKGEEWDLGLISGGGFRDTTRVSSGDPDMWSGIITANREALCPLIEDAIRELSDLRASLEGEGDRQGVKEWLADAKTKREKAMESCALGSTDDSTV